MFASFSMADHMSLICAQGDIVMEVIFYVCYGTAFVSLVIVQVLHGRQSRKTGHLPGALTGDALVKVSTGL